MSYIILGNFFFWFKEIRDARKIRNKILSNFELALQPGIDRDESERLLHIVIVGGGPTGVEFGAELYDFVEQVTIMSCDSVCVWDRAYAWENKGSLSFIQDVARLYREQQKQVQVTLVESNQILGAFDKRLQSYAEKKMKQRKRFNIVQSAVVGMLFYLQVSSFSL